MRGATVDYAQTDFSAGELTPRLRGRFDTPAYKKAVALARNWQLTVQGSLLRRNGTEFISELLDSCESRLIEFRTSKGERFAVAFGDQKIRVFDEAGDILSQGGNGPGPDLVTNGNFSNGETGWTAESTNTSGGTAYVSGGVAYVGYDANKKRKQYVQTVTAATAGVYRFIFARTTANAYTSPELHVRLESTVDGLPVLLSSPSVMAAMLTVRQPGTYTWEANLAAGTYILHFEPVFDPANPEVANSVVGFDDVQFFRTEQAPATAAPWKKEDVDRIQYVMETATDTLWLVHPRYEPRTLLLSSQGQWLLQQAGFYNAPTEWAGADGAADANWPGAIELYQGRLWLGGTPNQRSTVWASQSGKLHEFSLTSGGVVTDDSGIKFTAQTKGAVRWMLGRNPGALILGTDVGEYAVTASGGVLTPSDLQVSQTSAYGTAAIQAIQLGDQIAYVSNDRRKVRLLNYDYASSNWASHDLAITADHLMAGRIQEIHLARDPLSALVCVMESGELIICTFDRAEQVVAWWRFDTGASVHAAVALDDDDGTTLWIAVQRPFAPHPFLEKVSLDGNDAVQLDSCAKYDAIPESLVLDRLGHLEGQDVELVVDGVLRGTRTVSGGTVMSDVPGSSAVVGLPFKATAVTLPPGGEIPPRAKRRWNKVALRLAESALPSVNGYRLPERPSASATDAAPPPFSGDSGMYSGDWETEGALTIEQELPFRTEVVALFGTLRVSEV